MKLINLLAGAALSLAAVVGSANAATITAPVGTFVAFANVNQFTAGPVTVAPGITWTSTNTGNQGGSVYGWSGGYGFNGNGFSSGVPLAGLNDSSDAYGSVDTMTFAFSSPVSAVGSVLNWVPSNAPVTIAAYDASNNLLDSLVLSVGGAISVSPNSFYGFQEGSANISRFTLTDGYVAAIGGLTVSSLSAGVPEPAMWAMMLVGFGAVGLTLRGKKTGLAAA